MHKLVRLRPGITERRNLHSVLKRMVEVHAYALRQIYPISDDAGRIIHPQHGIVPGERNILRNHYTIRPDRQRPLLDVQRSVQFKPPGIVNITVPIIWIHRY